MRSAKDGMKLSVSGNIHKIDQIIERNKKLMDKYNIQANNLNPRKSPKPPVSLLQNKLGGKFEYEASRNGSKTRDMTIENLQKLERQQDKLRV